MDATPLSLIAEGARLERLATGAAWSEGPLYLPAENAVIWSDIPNDRVLRWSEEDGLSVLRQPCGFTNGRTLDLEGRVVECEHGTRSVTRREPDGSSTVLASAYRGKRLNSPNDVVVKSDGSIWFTDPPYGILSDREGHKADSELGACYVFRLDPTTGELEIASDALEHPNGLAFSPDESLLYVSDTSAAVQDDGRGNHHIVVLDVVDGHTLARPRVFTVVEPGLSDGFRIDVNGNLFSSAGDGIQVFAPDGTRLGLIPVPEVVSNCAFGGPERNRLLITASTSLYAIELATRGAVPPVPTGFP